MPGGAADRRTSMIRGLFGPSVAVAGRDIASCDGVLLPDEAAAMARAVPARRAEFTAGRTAAREAMATLGLTPRPVPMAPDRAPIWPTGIVGSLSHADGFAAAALADDAHLVAIGLDLEEDTPLEQPLWGEIMVADERAFLSARPASEQGRHAKLVFSAKECAYKCQYPLTGELLDFHALRVDPDPGSGRFTATFQIQVGRFGKGAVLEGRFACGHGLIATSIELPQHPKS